ncbi:hypothetical protein [Streptosporangium sp. CA-115845]|uniref:hypothetical protein n=1 Tax=Streptosporangium sp. CA-115845 TaxID=3240071 RepID=UPI003D93BF68
MSRPRVIAIDPFDCGCTECITGEYVPLRYATDSQIAALIRRDLRNHTGKEFDVTVRYIVTDTQPLRGSTPEEIVVTCGDRTWTFEPYLLSGSLP